MFGIATWKLVAGAIALAAAVSIFFWIKSLRSELEVAKFNYEIEKAAHAITEDTLDKLRQQNQINRQIEAQREEDRARSNAIQLEIKGTTSRADPTKNVPPPVLLDVLDQLRDSAQRAGAEGNTPGRSTGQGDVVPRRAADPAARSPRERRTARGADHRRHHARRPRLPKCCEGLRAMVGRHESAVREEA